MINVAILELPKITKDVMILIKYIIKRTTYVLNNKLETRYLHFNTFYSEITFWKLTKKIVCLLLFYVVGTSKLTSEQVPTCDSAHS